MSYTLLEQVKIRLKQFHIEETEDSDTGTKADKVVFDKKEDNPLIEQLLEQAKKEIISRRNYPDTYTKDQIDSDVKNYENIMVNLAVYDWSQAGEAYMASFSENGVSRTWKDRESLFVGVFPFVKAM
ncbi:hypothetical protein [Phocaeicola plebeius]|uniref:hypothetical protein n=1 Tax=Phocaeicola plebeius TaxID=310297 RepID=UPI0026E96844|nr:hypothetical protein [Phocaeicola plebeius]